MERFDVQQRLSPSDFKTCQTMRTGKVRVVADGDLDVCLVFPSCDLHHMSDPNIRGSLRQTSQEPAKAVSGAHSKVTFPSLQSRFFPGFNISTSASFPSISDKGWMEELMRLSGRTQHLPSNMGYPILDSSGGGYKRNREAYERQIHYLQQDAEDLSSGDPTAARTVLPMTIMSEGVS
ncbi:hypothetical protein BDW42DRAFT_8052 [Aspergillus taichungensis]|uniref:Uncharacterized protein n=1 Tax=Aspergillus taichungensis TaxID=482145 RepID=A0A2J5HJF6_9EURO|nr:hypothetical protein BDW42DRAFT_8052 [Aspergillus taichungensis]